MSLSALVAAAAVLAAPDPIPQESPPPIEAFLAAGKLAEGEAAMDAALKANPADDRARFSLGVVRFLRAVEARMQAFHRHGLTPAAAGGAMIPVTNLPIPINPKPEPIDGPKARALLRAWVDELAKVEEALAPIQAPDVKLPLRLGRVRLDFDGDGVAGEAETFWRIYARFNRGGGLDEETAEGFAIALDRGDVDWLRGYCHLLSAVAEFVLGHRFEDWFGAYGHLLFAGAAPSHDFQAEEQRARPGRGFDYGPIADLVAAVHAVRVPVAEPARLASVLTHLQATVALSRSSWKAILAEEDDDREWIPNPRQASVLGGARVSAEMVDGWNAFLDEFEAILAGKKLIPFWRGVDPARGVDLRKALLEPSTFDLILWAQGGAATPYLRRGPVSTPETWGRINRLFRGEFLGFAIWFN